MILNLEQNKYVYLSLGSNLGDRLNNINRAIDLLSSNGLEILKISPIYLTPALLLKNSPDDWNIPYLNCVIKCNCEIEPLDLLNTIKNIESSLGRDFSKRWSPRPIDIDISIFKNRIIKSDKLTIPHKEIFNRSFVLDPLSFVYEGQISDYYKESHQPVFMGIINIDDNSFSNDSVSDFNLFKEKFEFFENNLVQIIDIGAESTKPGTIPINEEDEIKRLSKIFEYIKNRKFGLIRPLISLDTYHPGTAKLAIENGFDIINDVSGFSDSKMLELAKNNKNIKFIFVHNNGLPANKEISTNTNIIEEVDKWLNDKIKLFNKYGIKKEQVIFDPGIGFGKTTSQNLQILQNIRYFHKYGFKILIGHSRKSFLKMFTSKEANERDFETLSISMAIAKDVDILRVHTPIEHMSSYLAYNHTNNQFV